MNRALAIGLCAASLPSSAGAALPAYRTFQIHARGGASDTLNVPAGQYVDRSPVFINNTGQIAFRLSQNDFACCSSGVWFGGGGSGSVVYTHAAGATLSGVAFNDSGVFASNFFNVGSPTSIMRTNCLTSTTAPAFALGGPFGVTGVQSGPACVNNADVFGAIVSIDSTTALMTFGAGGADQAKHAQTVGPSSPSSPYSSFLSLALNDNRQLATVARLGAQGQVSPSRPDEVRLFNPNGSSVLIARDHDADAASPFATFTAVFDVTETGYVLFRADRADGVRVLLLSNGSNTIEIATTAPGSSRSLPAIGFAFTVNEALQVAFRATDLDGVYTLFVGDGVGLRRIIREGDLVTSDNGLARVAPQPGYSNPALRNAPMLNEAGDVGIHLSLVSAAEPAVGWSSAVYVVPAARAVDMDANGTVNSGDLAQLLAGWGSCPSVATPCPADIDGDGQVGSSDLAALLASWD